MDEPMMNKRIKALTMLEMIIVVFIILALVALSLPALIRARHQAKITAASSNLRQVAIAASLYRQDYDHRSPDVAGGLPDYFAFYDGPTRVFNFPKETFFSPCGTHPANVRPGQLTDLTYYPTYIEDEDWGWYYGKYGESSIFLVDKNCGDHSAPLHFAEYQQLQLGMRLDGSLWRRVKLRFSGVSLSSWQ